MKKFFILFLTLFTLFTFTSNAADVKPGDTITVPISIGASDAHALVLRFTYDMDIFETVHVEGTGPNAVFSDKSIVMWDITKPIPEGEVGSITLKIKEDAPLGSYEIPIVYEAVNWDEEFITIETNIEPIEVKCPHSRTTKYVTKEATQEEEGSVQIICCDCKKVIRVSPIEKLPAPTPAPSSTTPTPTPVPEESIFIAILKYLLSLF